MNMENIFHWSDKSRAEGGLFLRKARHRDRIPPLEFTFHISSLSQGEAGPCSGWRRGGGEGRPELGWILMEIGHLPKKVKQSC